MTPAGWRRTAGWLALGLAIATLGTAAFSVSIGLLTGLVVLVVPGFVVLAWLVVVAIAVSLCMGWERRTLARTLGIVLTAAPVVAVVALYARSQLACRSDADPDACYAYLNGSPLLLVLVATIAFVGVGAAVAVWAVTKARPTARQP